MGKTFCLYMIGISGSGKTTIATALEKELKNRTSKKIQFIDGDVIRSEFGEIFGYTYDERMKCNRVVRVVVKYLVQNEISVILAQVGAYEAMRRHMRQDLGNVTDYVEIYVKCSLEECMKRDVKGYYKKQKEGLMENLNGANDVYEIPSNSEIVIDTENTSVNDAVSIIIEHLKGLGYEL